MSWRKIRDISTGFDILQPSSLCMNGCIYDHVLSHKRSVFMASLLCSKRLCPGSQVRPVNQLVTLLRFVLSVTNRIEANIHGT
jgi:hypothetical protein